MINARGWWPWMLGVLVLVIAAGGVPLLTDPDGTPSRSAATAVPYEPPVVPFAPLILPPPTAVPTIAVPSFEIWPLSSLSAPGTFILPSVALAPADPNAAGATAVCADGSWSFSAHRSGTCSHHGGVHWWTGNLGAAGPGGH